MSEGQVYEKELRKTTKGQNYVVCRIDDTRANDFNTSAWTDINIGDWVEYETRPSKDGRFTHIATVKKIKAPVQKGQDGLGEREYWVCKRLCYTLATDLVRGMVEATTKVEKLWPSRIEVAKVACEIGEIFFAAMMKTEEHPEEPETPEGEQEGPTE